jgi:hypothetical protein
VWLERCKTVTDDEPLELPNSGVVPKLAVTVFGPSARHVPLIVRVADVPVSDETRFAVPSMVVSTAKEIVPIGTTVPVQAITVAVRVVNSSRLIWFELAVNEVTVPVLVT